MHSNMHPNGSTYGLAIRLHEGRILHVYESYYENKIECYRVLDIPALGKRILILRCERIKQENAKGYCWKRAIEAANEATTYDRNRNGFWGPVER